MSGEAADALYDLDASLATDGHDIELQRLTGTQQIAWGVTVRAFVRGYSADEFVGGITQSDSKVIMSPTQIIAGNWPGPNSSATPTAQDRRIPKKGDKAVINGKGRNIEAAVGLYIANELVRIEMRVLG